MDKLKTVYMASWRLGSLHGVVSSQPMAFGVDGRNLHGAALAGGIYAYQVQAGSLTLTRNMLLLQ